MVDCSRIAIARSLANLVLAGFGVCWAALAVEQHGAIVVLGISVALSCGTAIPEGSERLVFGEAVLTGRIEAAKVALCSRRAQLGSLHEHGSPGLVLWAAEVELLAKAGKMVDRFRVVLRCGSLKPLAGVVLWDFCGGEEEIAKEKLRF